MKPHLEPESLTTTLAPRWRAYPAYKPSGIEWVQEIPTHWEVWKVTHAFKLIGSGTTPLTSQENYYDGGIPWVNTGELRDGLIPDAAKKITDRALAELPALRLYPAGTLLVALYGATIGKVGILQIPATTNQACCALGEPENLEPAFVFYWLIAHRRPLVLLASGGGQPNISQETIKSLRIPAPHLPEQRAIAAFLDRETAKLDALITKKEELIELLQEKRAAIISHAVTRGLDSAAPLKDSGVEWLGDIPAHWGMPKLSRLCLSICDGTHAPPPAVPGIHRLLSARNIVDGEFVLRDDDRTMAPEDFAVLEKSYTVRRGDVVMAIVGATTGKSAIVCEIKDVSVQRSIAILRPNSMSLMNSFLNYWLMSEYVQNHIRMIMEKYAAQPGIYLEDVAALKIPKINLAEQQAIVAFLDEKTAKIGALISTIRQAIEKVQEERTALIAAAVTGKIDAREEGD